MPKKFIEGTFVIRAKLKGTKDVVYCAGVARAHSEDEIEDTIKELGPLTVDDSIEIELEQ